MIRHRLSPITDDSVKLLHSMSNEAVFSLGRLKTSQK